MNIQNSMFLSNLQVKERLTNPKENKEPEKAGQSFGSFLKEAEENASVSELKFSKHASQRLELRNISLSNEQLDRLNEGTQRASEKGIKDSLVIVDSYAFIVNVPNHTVVTAMDQTESKENTFTNIDGAVIA